ncbi:MULTISPECIES: hypothetical protein [unclassified Burkholderia]|uniref:hypothetical protein n=1 Tax=unclassified Burkholderia TaxID=2613784 RepID=UPI000B79C743|nr:MULTISPECIES: hypothetical protein [unclassified Burkholderia]MBR8234208.1 hypothetical protein [Burkholderia sp. AU32357]OXI45841.1 hypothetical protein CFB49_09790 [Burkholderia sp. AU17457]
MATPNADTFNVDIFQELSVVVPEGNLATLAVVDQNGKIVEAGPSMMRAVWDIAISAYRNFLIGNGHLRVLSKPTQR